MDRCPQCGSTTGVTERGCPGCSFVPPVVDGLRWFAPELADQGPGFDPRHFEQLARYEADNFWFRARNDVILETLARSFPGARSYLEVGCGTGFVLQAVADRWPSLSVSGCEVFAAGLTFARQRVPRATLFQMDATRIPFTSRFDVIGAYDVLEHIAAQDAVLEGLHRAITPGGGLVLTVPQHQWLWSEADVEAHHVRRYEPGELEAVVRRAGFTVEYSTSFVSLLLPAMAASRLLSRGPSGERDPYREFKLPGALNRAFEGVLRVEGALRRVTGLRFPVGGSRLVVARR
jgi:SAM-dependent methyltransferase